MSSIRRTALSFVTVLLTIIAVFSILAAHSLATIEINKLLDNELEQIALNAGSSLSPSAHELIGKMEMENRIALQVWTKDGHVVEENPTTDILPRQSTSGFSNVVVDGNEWRVYTSNDGDRTTQAAQRVSARSEIANKTALATALPLMAAFPIAWIAIIVGLNMLLAQITRFSDSLALRSVDSKEPLVFSEMPEELRPIVPAMNSLIERHRQVIEQQKQFLAEAAHELRTPLAALQIQIDNFRHKANSPNPDSDLEELGSGIRRAGAMVGQLMKMARLDYQEEPPRPEETPLSDLLVSVTSDFVQLASKRGIELEMELGAPNSEIVTDADVHLLFRNLLDNAIRYTGDNGSVLICLRSELESSIVEITDNGTGIPDEALPRIFDRFYRAAPTDIEGTGLGLSIVRKIADRNGYVVSVANRRDAIGVCARVSIPRKTMSTTS